MVEAKDALAPTVCAPTGPVNGGAVRRICLPPITDVGTSPLPLGVFATLRARHVGDVVTMDWTLARAVLPGEHFHLKKAWTRPPVSWSRVNPERDLSRAFTETNTSAWLQFFDLRVASACEDESPTESPGRP